MAERIVQTAGRVQLGEFAPEFAHFNDDILFGENMKKSTISYYETDKKEMRASCLAEIARALYTTPDYLLGFEEEKDPFEKEALCILQGIKDDTVREMLLKQMKALV